MSISEINKPPLAETPEAPVAPANGLFGLVSRLATQNAALTYIANHDSLTGLLNRQAFRNNVEEMMQAGRPVGIINLDLDAFKAVNDILGHQEGDHLLEEFGTHLQSSFRREGEVIAHKRADDEEASGVAMGRTGGDEFLIALDLGDRARPDGLTPEQRFDKDTAYSRTVVAEFVKQQRLDIRNLGFDISLGTATWEPGSSETLDGLLSRADGAMYQDKQAHGAPVR